jgi:methionyl aminopeptidase
LLENKIILFKILFLVRPGTKYRDVGNEIQKHATANGCSVVRSYCGHGVHKYNNQNQFIDLIYKIFFRLFHCAPNIPHYASKYLLQKENIYLLFFLS